MAKDRSIQAPFEIGGQGVPPGEQRTIDLPLSLLFDHTPVTMTVKVVHGRRPGPRLFVSAAIHGDEINGVEIIRRLLLSPTLFRMRGTLIAVPVVNVYGFISRTRYLPDRRDLNRSFPGSTNGSLAAQLASLFTEQIVRRCTHGIDLHTGAIHRPNFPQIRCDLTKPEIREMSRAFGAPVTLHADPLEGSLRDVVRDMNIPIVLYEGGEALRLDELAIRVGLNGILGVMSEIGMTRKRRSLRKVQPLEVHSSYWVRAPAGGIFHTVLRGGSTVRENQQVGMIVDPFGESQVEVNARESGVIIGATNLPVVNQGDALVHIARARDVVAAGARVSILQHEEAEEIGSGPPV
ncbi:MAG: succinylglutamate desuccinylase/aspartoacylase family protein [bacterium]|nr:succinylglutamate desuccinylase/aspartoacylase family protein [bacterium]